MQMKKNGLGITAVLYISIDYIRHVSPSWHQRLQSLLWILLALAATLRIPFYKHWSLEFSSVIRFISSMIFMLSTLFIESIATRFVTVVVGLKWHRYGMQEDTVKLNLCIVYCKLIHFLLLGQ